MKKYITQIYFEEFPVVRSEKERRYYSNRDFKKDIKEAVFWLRVWACKKAVMVLSNCEDHYSFIVTFETKIIMHRMLVEICINGQLIRVIRMIERP